MDDEEVKALLLDAGMNSALSKAADNGVRVDVEHVDIMSVSDPVQRMTINVHAARVRDII